MEIVKKSLMKGSQAREEEREGKKGLRRESNPGHPHPKRVFYHLTTKPSVREEFWCVISRSMSVCRCGKDLRSETGKCSVRKGERRERREEGRRLHTCGRGKRSGDEEVKGCVVEKKESQGVCGKKRGFAGNRTRATCTRSKYYTT